jgi:hypothetical protein
VPLNPTTGEPEPAKAVRPRDPTPVLVVLKPGDYLVVAALDELRFHEVYRHVPKDKFASELKWYHQRWAVDPNGVVVLPYVNIPSREVREGMALVDGDQSSDADQSPSAFFIDQHEFTVAEYRRANAGARATSDADLLGRPQTCEYDEALDLAENVGRRLPTFDEYKVAAQVLSLSGGLPQWSSTREHSGVGDVLAFGRGSSPTVPRVYRTDSPGIGFRCARSARPHYLEENAVAGGR